MHNAFQNDHSKEVNNNDKAPQRWQPRPGEAFVSTPDPLTGSSDNNQITKTADCLIIT